MQYILFLIVTVIALLQLSCIRDPISGAPLNLSPETFLSIDSVHNAQASQLTLRWWGNDPDGLVKGFVFSFDRKEWTFTTKNDSTFALPIFRPDTTFSFFVSAVDNSVPTPTPGPLAFSDRNNNGMWDSGEQFIGLHGAFDPTPATSDYPVRNSPPTVEFLMVGDIFGTVEDIPETTFTVASFRWIADDIDGVQTITNYYIALNDTTDPSNWLELNNQTSFVTIIARGQPGDTVEADVYPNNRLALSAQPLQTPLKGFRLNARNRFYLKAKDVSDAYSRVVFSPGGTKPNQTPDTTRFWYVKKPKGELLIIDNYITEDNSQRFYEDSVFNVINEGAFQGKYDVLDIKVGLSGNDPYPKRGKLLPPFITPMFTETLKLFKYVFWYASDEREFEVAQRSLPEFRKAGGKVLFSYIVVSNPSAAGISINSGFDIGKQLSDMSQIVEGISPTPIPTTATGFVPSHTRVIPRDTSYPVLIRDHISNNALDGGKILSNIRRMFPSVVGIVLYDSVSVPTPAYSAGNVVLGVRDEQKTFVLMGIPLYRFNGSNRMVPEFFRKVFVDDFGM